MLSEEVDAVITVYQVVFLWTLDYLHFGAAATGAVKSTLSHTTVAWQFLFHRRFLIYDRHHGYFFLRLRVNVCVCVWRVHIS